MEIRVANDRVLLLESQLTHEEIEKTAWRSKTDSFGAFQKVSNFLNRPKDDDFQLVAKEVRYLPFWHIVGTARCVYDRTVEHAWPTGGPEVANLTLDGKDYKAENGNVYISVVEHCKQEESQELFVDGLTASRNQDLKKYLQFTPKEMQKEDMLKLSETGIVAPPQTRASTFVREIASKMIHSIDADVIFEEKVEFSHVDLYYRPVVAFKYKWVSKGKESTLQVDGLTGQITFGQDNFQQLVGEVFDYDFLFDIGKDAAGMFIPGGVIAVKLAKKYMDVARRKR